MSDNIIISIGRQIGAGGFDTAHLLADEFGYKLFDQELLQEAAKQSGIDPAVFETHDEKASSGRRGALGSFRSLFGGDNRNITNSVMTEESLFKVQSDVIRTIADSQPCIIIGRCSDYILRDYPNLVSVFISASAESRIRRIASSHNITDDEARRLIERGDRKREQYYNYYTFKKWGDSSSYDLCIDSSKLGDDISKVVTIIREYMKLRGII